MPNSISFHKDHIFPILKVWTLDFGPAWFRFRDSSLFWCLFCVICNGGVGFFDRLALLAQRAEISLQEKEKKSRDPVTPSPTPTAKAKKTQRIKALSPKVQRDEQLEVSTDSPVDKKGRNIISQQAHVTIIHHCFIL